MSRLQTLEVLLRDKAKWPEGFEWNYRVPNTCALGLAKAAKIIPDGFYTADLFRLSVPVFDAIFHTRADGRVTHLPGENERTSMAIWSAVTPLMVADRIKQHLETERHARATQRAADRRLRLAAKPAG